MHSPFVDINVDNVLLQTSTSRFTVVRATIKVNGKP